MEICIFQTNPAGKGLMHLHVVIYGLMHLHVIYGLMHLHVVIYGFCLKTLSISMYFDFRACRGHCNVLSGDLYCSS